MSTAARTFIATPLRREPSRAHAARIRRAIALVVLLVLVEAVERAAAGADDAADGRALARPLTAAGDRATGRAHRRADDRADRAVLHDLHRLVLRARLARRVLVAGIDGALSGDGRRARRASRRLLRRLLLRSLGLRIGKRSLLLLRRAVATSPIGDDQARHQRGDDHHGHTNRGQLPGIHRRSSGVGVYLALESI